MNSCGLRHLLLKSFFPVVFMIAILLAIVDITTQSVYAQVRTVTVTVYVTLVHTVPVYVPVTAYVTVASMATSFMIVTTTAMSVSLGTVTLWNTVTAVATTGILGPTPGAIFGPYSDLAMTGIGALGGALLTSLFFKLAGKSLGSVDMGSTKGTLAVGFYQQITDTITQTLTSAIDQAKKIRCKIKRTLQS